MQDIIIVGAGPSGIGLGVLFKKLGIVNFSILEKDIVGSSFYQWPKEMRLITPSFTGQGFGALDLNAIAPNTSPAYTFNKEHLSGEEYGDYLQLLAGYFELPIIEQTKVIRVKKEQDVFKLETNHGLIETRTLIWATGEFQFPNDRPFPGAEFARHNGQIKSWKKIRAEHATVIGGYESGVDAAYHLTSLGKKVTLISPTFLFPNEQDADPSLSLSPFTQERLRLALRTKLLRIIENTSVQSIKKLGTSFQFSLSDGSTFEAKTKPILATGFISGAKQINSLFEWQENGKPLLTENDESTLIQNLFLIGPNVQHHQAVFCFIYKFRQRFAVVAQTIVDRFHLPHDSNVFTEYRANQMYLEDLSCCEVNCEC
ncbi:NAD(P)/FAD-dependent oxidoreductase [Rummeliibacillus suwonensis]|uniref:NAD(P)/FAD-dependent oxidoreductase n=1 Tax=Rummeliibacillus suwonensis TaxID=1306154 RepID=UPI001AAE84ED|nr:NAD(P)/FAD-dependent oxidoreductase [Rummeliibacillus suwonensis]MBO2536707.1 NAD(P)-binding domain-containing protein [Rummeliibacillus suwonensis]